MLYLIAVVMIAAVIFLIVYNMKVAAASGEGKKKKASEAVVHNQSFKGGDSQAESNNEPKEQAQPKTDIPMRRKKVSSLDWEQSDDEYRKALRSFSGQDAASELEKGNQGETAQQRLDEAYREGLRSLNKQSKP
jgi:hypothetical protein